MTETTEEISEIERAQKLATLATEALYDEKKKVAELKRELEGLKFKAKDHAHQVNAIIQAKNKFQDENEALTKERGKLKAEVDDLNYRAEEDERTIISHEKEMDALKSQLSNREKEIEELKQNVRNFINEGEGFCPDCLDRALKNPEVDSDILRAQKSALQIHRNIKKRQDKKIESYENFKDSVIRSIKDCREVNPSLADCFENTSGIHVLLASLQSKSKEGEAQ